MSEQRSPQWFQDRLGKATASGFGKILSRTPAPRRNYCIELALERLTGIPTEGYVNAAMQWGIDTEELAAKAYEAITGNLTKPAYFVQHKTLMAGASPDKYVGEEGLLEVKCPNSATHIYYLNSNKFPIMYKPQVQGQLWITERQWCDFMSFDPRLPINAQIFIIRIERDEKFIEMLAKEVESFLGEVDKMYQYIKEYRGDMYESTNLS